MQYHDSATKRQRTLIQRSNNVPDGPLDARLSRRTLLRSAAMLGAAFAGASVGWRPISAGLGPIRPVRDYDAAVPVAWFHLSQRLVTNTPGFSPPVAARAYGCAGLTLYEALVPGIDGYQSLAGQVNDLTPPAAPQDAAYYWPIVANAALAAMFRYLFPNASPEDRQAIDVLEHSLVDGFAIDAPSGVVRRSIQRGREVADHVLTWSLDDGGHDGHLANFPENYDPPDHEDYHWEPTPPHFLPALQPFWGDNRPCAIVAADVCDPAPPPEFSIEPGSAFHDEAIEVYEAVNNLTEEQRTIARFWADDPGLTSTPPGHSISILTQVLKQEQDAGNATLATAAEAYVKVGMAVNDAFVSCWRSKYTYNLLRPITYINRYIDEGWGHPLPVETPPFPEYTSGHSVQSGATAEVLTDLFGEAYAFTDHTHDDKGFAPRSFVSFDDFAEEAAISRLYGGIHFRSAIDVGVDQGRCVGNKINQLAFTG